MQVFRSFFIKLKNPSNIIAGNSAAVQISLFNYNPIPKMVMPFNLRLPFILLCISLSCFSLKVMFHFNYHLQVPYTFNFIIINCFKVLLYIWFQDYFGASFITVRQMLIKYPFRIILAIKLK